MVDIQTKPPHSTLYVSNINEAISKTKLSYVLNRIFGRYGEVVDVRVRRSLKMKGQAFVTYKDARSCEKALSKLQGRPVFKKPIHIVYAHFASDKCLELNQELEELNKRKEQRNKKQEEETKIASEMLHQKQLSSKTPEVTESQLKLWKLLPPHKVLLLQNLTSESLESSFIEEAFDGFAGFEKVRLIKFRKLAFIDFDLESQATQCLKDIDASKFGAEALLTYAKK
ncbi:hypothetical protein PUMCH_004259 [Australozyma saopauloensis]|uniref:RRM domain-containing protein n=1 Tax=Australozyma saopauloensis TaxID=291208 RepID=A0AAX4HEE3_9ASCO|nr:hypothetical protein PUMCH_004259 [[Candida] saopauloensis]